MVKKDCTILFRSYRFGDLWSIDSLNDQGRVLLP